MARDKEVIVKNKRSRILYGGLTIFVMLLGLGSRQFSAFLPTIITKYSGDILWAIMIYLGISFLFPRWTYTRILIFSLLFSYSIELSQLYQAVWIDNIRNTRLGGLILGYGFLWSDIICYTAGISIGFMVDNIGRGMSNG
jgi:glycopeptide antibiotics resistance protein